MISLAARALQRVCPYARAGACRVSSLLFAAKAIFYGMLCFVRALCFFPRPDVAVRVIFLSARTYGKLDCFLQYTSGHTRVRQQMRFTG
jgi:hypothetical protein